MKADSASSIPTPATTAFVLSRARSPFNSCVPTTKPVKAAVAPAAPVLIPLPISLPAFAASVPKLRSSVL